MVKVQCGLTGGWVKASDVGSVSGSTVAVLCRVQEFTGKGILTSLGCKRRK